MKKLYEKNELHFTLVWIGIYVILNGVAEYISQMLGTEKLITVPVCIGISLILLFWIKKNSVIEKYGLCKFQGSTRQFLYFLPLIVISTTNLWGGFALNFSPLEIVLYIISMLCVGFLEEVIFRGFLFKALCKKSVKTAFIISGLTFGIGHIVNLLSGAELISTLLQIAYATAIGFMYTAVFYKGKSLIPCIISHAVMTSAFAVEPEVMAATISAIVLIVISVGYAIILLKPKKIVQEI
ncbi:MAG: CPBP family intramembrane metalloprotease [Oscillospiraceae bacterium]|jgi:membrane protease YdiL (CAAX protease family)|nr:CPBP family intramembrane metalloprotease [Oscillospiraceae bacterium]